MTLWVYYDGKKTLKEVFGEGHIVYYFSFFSLQL